jgi:hypothetical protein
VQAFLNLTLGKTINGSEINSLEDEGLELSIVIDGQRSEENL